MRVGWKRILCSLALALGFQVTICSTASAFDWTVHRSWLYGEGGYIISSGDAMPIAENDDSPNVPYLLDTENGGNIRFGLGVDFCSGWDMGVRYAAVETNRARTRLNNDNDLRNVYGIASTYYDTLDATAKASYSMIDFEVGRATEFCSGILRLAAGVRYADIRQQITTDFNDSDIFLLSERHNVQFNGWGPTIGGDYSHPLAGYWDMRGKVLGSVLFGDLDRISYVQADFVPSGVVLSEEDRTAYTLETELAVSRLYALGHCSDECFEMMLGYRAEFLYDVNDTTNISSDFGNVYGDPGAGQIYHGPFLRGTLFY